MEVSCEYISAACNCTYNCIEISEDFILYGSNKALALYEFSSQKVRATKYYHKERINCVRFVKKSQPPESLLVTCCAGGRVAVWSSKTKQNFSADGDFEYNVISSVDLDVCVTVCDGIIADSIVRFGCITGDSRLLTFSFIEETQEIIKTNELNFMKSLANELCFWQLEDSSVLLAVGLDTGSVNLYGIDKGNELSLILVLSKHEDWVRCIDFITLDNGETLMATGGQDSFISVWRFKTQSPGSSNLEFQVHKFKNTYVVFDSIIVGHEGWVNSLCWSSEGELLSCSSDQSIILWENLGDIWLEKTRLGVVGGMVPGGCCAKQRFGRIVASAFQGAIQIWKNDDVYDWNVCPSITGHFRPISDMDYDPEGLFVVTTSEDQTTRIHAPWGSSNWHEISRPQIHGHDLFACRCIQEYLVSGAEEKILRAFQPTEIFYKNLEDSTSTSMKHRNVAKGAFLPALGLSNQTEESQINPANLELPLESRLDEDFLRSQTLWLEVSKLYGHVYEISCIATSPTYPLIASASQATKPQFAAIILWSSDTWKNLGEFQFHKLNVTAMEFSPNGNNLLSVSRDRSWAVWNVIKKSENSSDFAIEVLQHGSSHTRAIWTGTWNPTGEYFLTGGRDKKVVVWKKSLRKDTNNHSDFYGDSEFSASAVLNFNASVSSAAVNCDNILSIGLETGEIEIFKYSLEEGKTSKLTTLDNNAGHHGTVKRLKFNPKNSWELASAGTDNILKIFKLSVKDNS